jgi:hypothetical protein
MEKRGTRAERLGPVLDEAAVSKLLREFAVGQQEAIACFTVAISRVIGRDRLAEELRLQLTSYETDRQANPVRDDLLRAAWESIRPPAPTS